MGSASEVEYQLELARDLRFLEPTSDNAHQSDLLITKKMLNAFIKKLRPN